MLKLLVARELFDPEVDDGMLDWLHSGFRVHDGVWLDQDDKPAHGRLSRYCARCPVSLERLAYDAEAGTVTYTSDRADGPTSGRHTFEAADFIALLVALIPERPTVSPKASIAALLSLASAALLGSAVGCTAIPAPPSPYTAPSASSDPSQHSAAATQNPYDGTSPFPTPVPSATIAQAVSTTSSHPTSRMPVASYPNVPTFPIRPALATPPDLPTPPTPPTPPPPPIPLSRRPTSPTTTLAGVHFAGHTSTAAQIFGAAELRGWSVELSYVNGGESPARVASRMLDLTMRGFRPILRIDYAPGQNIPPALDPDALASYSTFAASVVDHAAGTLQDVVVGNEPNIDVDGSSPDRHTECRSARADCSPAAYARTYRHVRAAIAPYGADAIVAGVSPGTAEHPARWMGGPEYLAAVLAELPPGTVDGIALHAYGLEADPVPGLPPGRLAYFQTLVERQLAVIDAAGHGATPLYLTEMNEYTDPDAAFIRAAYAWLDQRNASRRGDILAAAWFVWYGGGTWDAFALERAPADVRAAFAEVAQTYPPGR